MGKQHRLLVGLWSTLAAFALLFGLVRFLAAENNSAAENDVVALPTDRPAVRIEVDAAGIYEIDHATLVALGIWPQGVNPAGLQMMHAGKAVAYQFLGDNDAKFEAGEKIRFYGWGIESRYDKLYVDRNVFWLWAQGNATRIVQENNQASNPPALSWRSVITFEQDAFFTPTYAAWSATAENAPDAWYWDFVRSGTATSYALTLPHPMPTGPDAQYTVELFSRYIYDNRVLATLAGDPTPAARIWQGRRSINVNGSVPQARLTPVNVTLTLTPTTTPDPNQRFNLNRITVSYERAFMADNGMLAFSYSTPGPWRFNIKGLASAPALLAWDISDRRRPIAVRNVLPRNPAIVGRTVAADRPLQMLVTSEANVRAPLALSRYDARDLTPAAGSASWLAIGYAEFVPALERLAAYRNAADGLSAHVVPVDQVYNQYGYGLATPDAIKRFVAHAYANWGLQSLVLGGDTTQNPTGRPCLIGAPACLQNWNTWLSTPSFVVTDLVFKDRFLGLVPSDFTYGLVTGGDLLAEVQVGRLAARTADEMDAMVDKTIRYDMAVHNGEPWTSRLLFVADNADSGGDFCLEQNDLLANFLPPRLRAGAGLLCLDDYMATGQDAIALRADLFDRLNSGGSATSVQPGILNYRGHGGISFWGTTNSPQNTLLQAPAHDELWDNADYPTVILSADCLDGHFAWLGQDGLAESFLRLRNAAGAPAGTAAHWGSSGLGYSFEHTLLHDQFYVALFQGGANTIGAAIDASKRYYLLNTGGGVSELYTMTLHGDPALRLANSAVPTAVGLVEAGSRPTGMAPALALLLLLAGLTPGVVRRRRGRG